MMKTYKFKPTYDILYKQYILEEHSTVDIANECGATSMTVWRWLKESGINVRSKAHQTNRTKNKISISIKKKCTPERNRTHSIKMKGKQTVLGKTWKVKDTSKYIKKGKSNNNWKGGRKLSLARLRNKRRKKGFVLITKNNPYTEPVEYHHIHPQLPYVIPVPKRIHKMFSGKYKSHFNNVNAMVGVKFELEELCTESTPVELVALAPT